MTDDAPQHDGTTMLPHIDSKRRKKLRQKKTAPYTRRSETQSSVDKSVGSFKPAV